MRPSVHRARLVRSRARVPPACLFTGSACPVVAARSTTDRPANEPGLYPYRRSAYGGLDETSCPKRASELGVHGVAYPGNSVWSVRTAQHLCVLTP